MGMREALWSNISPSMAPSSENMAARLVIFLPIAVWRLWRRLRVASRANIAGVPEQILGVPLIGMERLWTSGAVTWAGAETWWWAITIEGAGPLSIRARAAERASSREYPA